MYDRDYGTGKIQMNLIYDFETLGPAQNGAAVSMAILKFDETKYVDEPYEYEDLLAETSFIKFNVAEQVEKYNRIVDKSTLEWWQRKEPEARIQLEPSDEDRSITELWQFFSDYSKGLDLKKVYTRGNGFDPIVLESIVQTFGYSVPYPWWIIRDTRSTINGMSWGSDLDDKFIPEGLNEKFIHHDPRHDIVMDVMRMQTIAGYL